VGVAVAETVIINSSSKKIVSGSYEGYTYSCTSGSLKSCSSGYLKLTYTLMCTSSNKTCKAQDCGSGGGTCVCPYNAYISSSGGCTSCNSGTRAVSPSKTGVDLYHNYTSCNYCDYGKYPSQPSGVSYKVCMSCSSGFSDGQTCMDGSSCSTGYYNGPNAVCTKCPGGGTSTGGKIGIKGCYLPTGTEYKDAAGNTYEYTSNCYYS
jgi:hypothetical protein